MPAGDFEGEVKQGAAVSRERLRGDGTGAPLARMVGTVLMENNNYAKEAVCGRPG